MEQFLLSNYSDGLFHLIDKINFWYSSGIFLCRSLVVLFFAASVNDSAKAPLELLRAAPTKKWGSDVLYTYSKNNLS